MHDNPEIAALRARMAWEQERHAWEASLKPTDAVRVKWGYGSGHRAHGVARVVRVNEGSIRVALLEPVSHGATRSWPQGFEFSVPRVRSSRWNEWNGAHPVV